MERSGTKLHFLTENYTVFEARCSFDFALIEEAANS